MTFFRTSILTATALAASLAMANAMDEYSISGSDQDVSGGTVTASDIMTAQDGWLVVHRTDANMKPGPPMQPQNDTGGQRISTKPHTKHMQISTSN